MKAIPLLIIAGLSGLASSAPVQSDSFNGTVIDPAKWQLPPSTYGNAVLSQNNSLYYHNNSNGTSEDEINLYATGVASVTSDWTVRFDAHVPDLAKINTPGQSVGLEMKIWNSIDDSNRADIQMGIFHAPVPYGKVRSVGADITNDDWVSDPAPGGSTGVFQNLATQGRITLAFSWKASTSTLSAWYAPAGGATDWIRLTSWNLGVGSPTEWSLGPTASFMFYISGSSADLDLLPADNVRITDFVVNDSALTGRIPPTITAGDNPSRPDFIPLPGASEDTPYATTIGATGGVLPHAWSMVLGGLPPGLTLDPTTGTIQGTPTLPGSYPFRIRVTGADGAYAEGSYSIEVGTDPFDGSYSPPMKSHDNIRSFTGNLAERNDYTLTVTQGLPTQYTATFVLDGGGSQTIPNLLLTGNRIQNSMRPQSLSDADLLDFIMLSDGTNRAFVHVAQETDDPDDISFGVASWTSHVGNVTVAEWAGTWSFDTYGDSNLRDYANGFDHDLFPAIEIQQVDAERIQIILPNGGALPLRVSGNSAFIETPPLIVGTIRYHEFRLQGDGQRMSMHSVASEIDDLTDVSVTIGLGEKTLSPTPFTYTSDGNEITITGYTGSGGAVTIPSSIEGLPVTKIGDNAFSDEDTLISVTISAGVTSIGYDAFWGCTSLASVTIPSSVTSIGSSAFGYCTSLTAISVDGLNAAYSSLNGVLFNKSQTTLIQFPAGRTGTYAIPDTVTSIGYGAFENCANLTTLTIPASVTSIGSSAFRYCPSLTAINVDLFNSTYSSPEGVLFNKNQTTLIQFPTGKGGVYTIPDSVTTIEQYAFHVCASLSSITIPNSVTSIGDWSFSYCRSLTNIMLPNSITTIGRHAFSSCNSLSTITIPNSVISIGDNAFYACDSLTSAVISVSVTGIGTNVFGYCTSLMAITVDPLNIAYSSLNGVLFNKNQSILIQYPGGKEGDYTIPESVTKIRERAFDTCSLANVLIPNSITHIGNYAFIYCSNLTSVTIPASVVSIGNRAFYYTSLSSATFLGSAPAMGWDVFDYTASAFTVYYYTGKSGFTEPAWMGYPSASLGLFPGPDIAVEQSADTVLADGEAKDFGAVAVGEAASLTFTIRNTGAEELTGLALSLEGPNSDVYSFSPLGTTTLAFGASITFSVTFTPTASTASFADLHIASNDADQNPFDVNLSGNLTVADAIDQPGLAITSGGTAQWFPQTATTHDGVAAARSGAITDDEESWMQTTLNGPGTLTFWWMVSSEEDFDYLEFHLDGTRQSGRISGEVDWQLKTYSIAAGTHTVKWRYMKDETVSDGTDCGWVDEMSFVPGGPCDPPAGVVSWWTGDDTANDSIGTNHGILVNGATYAAGRYGKAFSFDGMDDFVEVANAANLNFPPNSTGTFEFWFLQTAQNFPVHFLGKRIEAFTNSMNYQIGFGWERPGNPFATGVWTHLAQVYDTTGISIYVNGTLFASYPGATFLPTNTVPLRLGTSDSLHEHGQSFAGLMDNIRIYNRALTTAEVQAIANCVPEAPPFTYTSDGNETTITGYSGADGDVIIPDTLEGLPVTTIGDYAFAYDDSLTSVTIPTGVTSIGDGAFIGCKSLTSFTIPSSVTRIGDGAFADCSGLTSITIPANVTSIGSLAFGSMEFDGCSALTSITVDAANPNYSSMDGVLFNKTKTTLIQYPGGKGGAYVIPSSVTTIGDGAFQSCRLLSSVTIPSSITSIGAWAFHDCSGLTSVTISASVTSIGQSAFADLHGALVISVDGANPVFSSVDGVLFDKLQTWLIQYPAGKAGAYTIPAGVTHIGDEAFTECYQLTALTIADSVTSIGNEAFANCTRLPSLTIPSSVTSIGDGAFADCNSLTSITIPESVTSIGNEAFEDCHSLTSITIPESVSSIGDGPFSDCHGLISIIVEPANLNYSSLDGVLFDKLKTTLIQYPEGKTGSYTIPSSVTSIGARAFEDCRGITSVTVPASVTDGWGGLPSGCASLTSITVDPGNPVLSSEDGVLFDKLKTMLLLYPGAKSGSYTIPASVAGIWDAAFEECSALVSITVDAANPNYSSENGVLFDKLKTFLIRCPSGKGGAYTIPASVTKVAENAFYQCNGLTSLTIPASVLKIGEFEGCGALTEFIADAANPRYSTADGVLFNKMETILLQCPAGKVGAYTISEGVIRIDDYSFESCSGLTSISIPASVTSIGEDAFYECRGLASALFQGNAPTMVDVAFDATAPGFTVYYFTDATGFTSPTWMGYPAVNLGLLLGNYDYRLTTNAYSPQADWSVAVKQEFGPNAEVVDWNTLKNDFGGSVESLRGFFDYLGILPYPDGDAPAVTRDGSQIWSGSRSYGVNRLEGNVPGGYLVHDQIQNNWVALGSWPADRRIIARVPHTNVSGPDLVVSISAPLAAVRGVNFDYTITVTNQGLVEATDIGVRFILPANLQFVSAQTWSGGSPVVVSGGVVDFPGGTLAAGASATLKLTVTPTAAGAITLAAGGVVADPANAIVEADEGNNGNPVAVVTEVRAPSDVAALAHLALSPGTLSPPFASGTLYYTANVPNAVASFMVTPEVADAGMTVSVNGTAVASGAASELIALEVGENLITTVVTAEDGSTTRTYRIIVTRLEPMVVVTEPASGLTPISALLRGTVNPRDIATVYFEYGLTTAYGFATRGQEISGTEPVAVSATVGGLSGATVYHYRAIAVGGGSTVYGEDLTFTTMAEAPVAATGSPVAVSTTGATMVGAVNPKGLPVQVKFEYGLTTLYGSSTPVQNQSAGFQLVDVLAPVTGLVSGATYHYRIVATTSAGTTRGASVSFIAKDGPSPPSKPTAAPDVTTGGFANVTAGSAELKGSVNPHGGTTVVQFEYGTSPNYGLKTAPQAVGNGTDVVAVSLPVSNLLPGTTYHYRLTGTNSLGTTPGADADFTTLFSKPVVVTGAANAISSTSARVTGTVRARNAEAQVTIDYGTNPSSLTQSVTATPASISGDVTTEVSAQLPDLVQGNTYYYRVRAENSGGIGLGGIGSFAVGVVSDLFQQFPGEITATEHQGALTVNLTPAGIGGGWRFAGERQWRLSGSAATGLTSGYRELEFRPVPGYLQAPAETLLVISDAPPVVLERAYTTSGSAGSGGLSVTLKPASLAESGVPEASRAQWRLFGESDTQWKDSGTVLTNLAPGEYLIDCKPVAGRTTPPTVSTQVADGAPTAATITYFQAGDDVGTPPEVVPFNTVSTRHDRPYAYVGQISSDVGTSSGFAVRPRVVATAGHVVFDDGTLAATTGLQWFFQRDRGVHEPAALAPRGYYLMSGYAARRALDNSPGTSTPESQNLDAAALYFPEDAARGGFSGYLASDSTVNQFVISTALKTLVGYPVDGIDPADQGRLHATPLANVTFAPAFGQTYTTSEIRSIGGNSGGPLCVRHTNGVYYPAAIYLGGTAQTVVRAIDGDIVDLFGYAEVSAYAGTGGTGGSITQSGTTPIGTPTLGAIEVRIEPEAARAAGAGWRIQATEAYQASGTQITDVSPNSYAVQFETVSGFLPPASQPVIIQGGQKTIITFTYEELILPPVITSPNTVTGTRGQPLAYQITATESPGFFSLLGTLPEGMSFDAESHLISGTPQEAGIFPVTVGATGIGGSDSMVVNLTVRPVLAAQSLTVPFQQAMSYQIASSESGADVTYSAPSLPTGLTLDATTGRISGTPTVPGLYHIPISVTRKGATASTTLTMTITGTVPEITLQPVEGLSIEYGTSATLIVAASGLPAPKFQWYQGASGVTTQPVAGATSATFTTPPLTTGTSYWARATSISGSADSTAAVISIVPSTNANLASLSLSAGALSPAFNAAIASYVASVPYISTSTTLTPMVRIGQSVVTINGAPATSGVANGPFALAVGTNDFDIEVTAGDGTTSKTYDLTITRAAAPPPPVATTELATGLTDFSAMLRGTVIPNSPVSVRFQYGRTLSYGDATSWQNVSGTALVPVQAALSGLSGDTEYHYRIVVSSVVGTYYGDDMMFTTSRERPIVATGMPANIHVPNGETTYTAILIGAVNPNGNAATVHFEYGPTAAYGSVTTDRIIPSGFNVVDVQETISGLAPLAFHHFRIVATTEGGLTSYGDDVTFQASTGGGDGIVDAAPEVTTGGVADLTTTSASLKGMVNPHEGTTLVYFEYGPTTAYGSRTLSEGKGNGNVPVPVSIPITGLLAGTVYHYRLVASNSLGTVYGDDATFTAGYDLPLVTTGAAAALSTTSATVSGSVRARGGNAAVWIDYGTDGLTFPNSIRAFPANVTGDTETPVTADLPNLNGVVTYFYRVRAVNTGGSGVGGVSSFKVGALLGLVQHFTREVPAAERRGQVLVNLLPAGIGGWRFVGEPQWRASGQAVTGLTTGDREIEYQPVPGHIQPPGETMVVDNVRQPLVVMERIYYESAATGQGTLNIILEPESLTGAGVPVANRAQWRLASDGSTVWRNSGEVMTGLMPGSYLVECKTVPGKNTPPPINVLVTNGDSTTATITYAPASAPILNPPAVVPFATTSNSHNLPYEYVGQVRSATGSYSGFVVKPRVVATAAQAVFDEATLAATSGMQWLLQRDRGTYEPDPQVPRGFYSFDGYAAQRAAEHTPGTLSLESQDLNVAALYFAEDAGRGGFSGFLASDEGSNPYLQSSALKTLVGYPVSGIAPANQGRMHATPPVSAAFAWALGRTYTSVAIRGIGGMAGGPLCVQRDGGNYYPAGIYVGGINHGSVRAIDSGVIDLFTRADVSSNGGDNNTGGGITHTSFTSLGSTSTAGVLSVTIEPAAALTAGAYWRLRPETSVRLSGAQKSGLYPGTYVLEFPTLPGFPAPSQPAVTVSGGQLTAITFTYGQTLTALESWRLTHFGITSNSGDAADNADPDGDGSVNRSEYAAGTNPKSALDVFRILTTEKSTAGFTVTVDGKKGRSYTLQRADSLAAGVWSNVVSIGPLPADQASVPLTDTSPAQSSGFYRMEVSAP